MKTYKINNIEEAGLLVRMLIESLEKKEKINIGLPGGRSIIPILKEFKNIGKNTLEKINFFLVDERMTGEKNSSTLFENYFQEAINNDEIKKEDILFPDVEGDIEIVLQNYEKKLPEKFDIIILGVGEDGHVASLFSGNECNFSKQKVVFVNNSPKEPKERISLSFEAFNKDAIIVLLFLGEGKKEVLKTVLEQTETNEKSNCPACYLLEHEEVHIITDQNID